MKRTLLLSCFAMLGVAASAQINKGAVFLGGNLAFSTTKVKTENMMGTDQKATNYSIVPSAAFAYKENRLWGFSLGIGHTQSDASTSIKEKTYSAGAFLRQYKPVGKDFYLFAQESLTFLYDKYTSDYSGYGNRKMYAVSLGFTPGIAYDASKKIQLELSLGNLFAASFMHSSQDVQSGGVTYTQKSNSFQAQTVWSNNAEVGTLNLGAKFVLGRK